MKRIGAAILLAAAGMACAGPPDGPSRPPLVGSIQPLVYCSEASPEGFDPALYTSGTTLDASSRQIYDRLVHFEPGGTRIVPGLAHSWEISEDGLEYTFHLRRGVKFHTTPDFTPSRDFNAQDVVFSILRQRDEEHPYNDSTVYPASYEYFQGMAMSETLRDVIAVDDYTVKFVLQRPEAPFLANLAMDFASILSQEYAERLLAEETPDRLNLNPVGTGPYRLERYRRNDIVLYRAHPEYWAGKAPTENLIFAITPNASVRYERLRSGECHVISYPNPADIGAMRRDPGIRVLEQEGLNVGYVAFNTLMAPFDNPTVRRALIMAINREVLVDRVFRGTGIVARNPIPPGLWSYNDEVRDYPYDPDRARELLAEAGVSGLKMRLWALPISRPYNPNGRLTAELIQSDWAEIGVEAEIVTLEWGLYLELSASRDRDGAVMLGWTSDNGDPDNFLGLLLGCNGVGGSNRANWCDDRFDRLIRRARTLSDRNERVPLYERAQVIFHEQAPWVPLAHSIVHEAIRSNVRGYRINPFGFHQFYGVELEEQGAAR